MRLSPWEAVLGEGIAELAPSLRTYFSRIPEGSVGRGAGVFEVVGSPRRALRPLLALLGALRILWPGWGREVPFTVRNWPDGETLRSERIAVLPWGSRTMVDRMSARHGELVDRVGRGGLLETRFAAEVREGRLELRSTRVLVHVLGLSIPILRFCAPRVTLTESAADGGAAQRVELTLDAPLLGRIYEYRGSFRYEIGAP